MILTKYKNLTARLSRLKEFMLTILPQYLLEHFLKKYIIQSVKFIVKVVNFVFSPFLYKRRKAENERELVTIMAVKIKL